MEKSRTISGMKKEQERRKRMEHFRQDMLAIYQAVEQALEMMKEHQKRRMKIDKRSRILGKLGMSRKFGGREGKKLGKLIITDLYNKEQIKIEWGLLLAN